VPTRSILERGWFLGFPNFKFLDDFHHVGCCDMTSKEERRSYVHPRPSIVDVHVHEPVAGIDSTCKVLSIELPCRYVIYFTVREYPSSKRSLMKMECDEALFAERHLCARPPRLVSWHSRFSANTYISPHERRAIPDGLEYCYCEERDIYCTVEAE
jgi:hypothetical protein